MKTLETLLLNELADIYDAESRLSRAWPKMAKAATHEELRDAFESYSDETAEQTEQLKKVFAAFGKTPRGKKCEAIAGLMKESEGIAAENKGAPTINAALISAAQKIKHYEIASYGCLREWAEQLGNDEATEVLQAILFEEKAADQRLTELARQRCNESAQEGGFEPEGRNRISARLQTAPINAL
jgi:ferritin-like metal-binding protein YciE